MRRIWKRACACMLALAVSVSSVNMSVFAQEETGVVIEEDVISVSGNDAVIPSVEGEIVPGNGTEATVTEETEKIVGENEAGGWDQITTEAVYEGENYKVTFTLKSYWDVGYNANVKLENTGDSKIQNWYLSLDNYNNAITNIWNAEISTNDEADYVIKNVGWNQDIAADSSIEFGISGDHAFRGFPEKYELIGTSTEVKEEDYTIQYKVDGDWGTGFYGAISVTNNTDTALEDWVLEFDFDREITEIWDGVIESHEGNHYVVRNVEYNSTIAAGESVSIGIKGCEGEAGDEPRNFELYSYKESSGNKVSFVIGAENVSNIPETQVVSDGGYAQEPETPVRDGHYFMGWYLDNDFIEEFDFASTAIHTDVVLYARWVDYLCETDSDDDGIVDSLEEYFGTDLFDVDTDDDDISDYQEVYEVGTHPLRWDSDGNGIDDYHEDTDGDGIVNGEEVRYNTNASYDDTDTDDLTDYDEIFVYFTDPTLADTDGDRAPDGWEIAKGYNPLVADSSFPLTATSGTLSEANPVIAKVNMEAYDADVRSLTIDKVFPHDNMFITPFIAGYLAEAYDFTIDGKFDTAELIFEYDSSLGQLSDEFQPRIYYFDEETKTFEELENQIVEEGRVIAYTTHFSTYILLNKVEFDKVWNTEIKTSADGDSLSIGFVVDLSGSMSGSKLSTTKTAINSFIDVLDDTDTATLVSFTSSAFVRCTMTEDKSALKTAVKAMSAGGLTSIYKGIENAIEVFEDTNPAGYRIMIVFTDGYDEPATSYDKHYKDLVERAKENEITIYTVGISTIDEALLTKVAEATGGKYYYASVISELQSKVEEIKEEAIDYKTDSNEDGISDYYTKMIEEGTLVLSNSSDELKGINFNYDENGKESADWDGDGIKNGDEIKVVHSRGKVYLEMYSHPLQQHSDRDGMDDYTEMQNGTDPLSYEAEKVSVDRLCTDDYYYFESIAGQMRDDKFVKGLIGYSAIVNGVWNRQELYRDLIIDYYSTYITEEVVEEKAFEKEVEYWYDWLVDMKAVYDGTFNFNKLLSSLNGVTNMDQLHGDFILNVGALIIQFNQAFENGTEFRFYWEGMDYVKRFYDSEKVFKFVGNSKEVLDSLSNGISYIIYAADIIDSVERIAMFESNIEVFDANMVELENISLFSDDKHMRAAADEVMDLLASKYLEVFADVIETDAGESIFDGLLYLAASKCGYVAIVVAARDLMNLFLDSKTDVQQMYRIFGYSEMCDAYIKPTMIKLKVSDNQYYYDCFHFYVDDVICSLEHIARLRIMGEQEYYAYIKNDSFLLSREEERWGVLDDLKKDIEQKISVIKEYADRLYLNLSFNIKYNIE